MTTLKIPVKTHVKKYLVKQYGAEFKANKKTFFGTFIIELLDRETERVNYFKEEVYTVTVDRNYTKKTKIALDGNKLRSVGNALEVLFIEDFYKYVDGQLVSPNASAYQAVKNFLKIYDISEDDLKLETMYRKYQRYSNEKIDEKKIKYSKKLA